ncbi:hypothetical protein Pcinc_032146, partial [Petrolisthes cinctipes]
MWVWVMRLLHHTSPNKKASLRQRRLHQPNQTRAHFTLVIEHPHTDRPPPYVPSLVEMSLE